MNYRKLNVIISGGGTGGHIFPAISIANALKEANPESEILFVGAEGKMEMEKVPAAGYRIEGIRIAGLQRKLSVSNIISNLKLPFILLESLRKAGAIIDRVKPDIVIGVGGYASAPLLYMATRKKVKTLIQEQNGFAGLTNKILSKKAGRICVAYEGMEKFFPAEKIVLTGNPIRSDIHQYGAQEAAEGVAFYGFTPGRKHLLVIGGSLGSGTLNNSMKRWIEAGCPGGDDVEVLWQCGKYYKPGIDKFMQEHPCQNVTHTDFIARMDLAYAMADVLISRSGASSVSEICAAGKAAIFVPSPNVAEDHQTHNAMALVNKGAARIVRDSDAPEHLLEDAMEFIHNPDEIEKTASAALGMALPDAAKMIVEEIYKIA